MDINEVLSGMDLHGALFGVNSEPTQAEIEAAQQEVIVWGEAAEKLVSKVGLRKGHSVSEQPVYGPLVRMLSLAGWTIGGSGYFSAVFYKGGLAIKLSLRGTSDAAMDYLNWCKDHQGLPGIPQVYAMKQSANTYCVLMERYEAASHLLNPKDAAFCYVLEAEFKEIQEAINTGAAPLGFHTGATALAIHDQFKDTARFDVHRGNVMLDRNGKLVITDPLGRSFETPEGVTTPTPYSYYSDSYSKAA